MRLKLFAFLLCLLPGILIQCKKAETDLPPLKETRPPLGMVILQGNNQAGKLNAELPDTIIVKIKPADTADIKRYSYFSEGNNNTGYLRVWSQNIINGEVHLKLLWTTGNQRQQQDVKLYITDCHINMSCTKLDSVKISAVINEPWSTVYTNTGTFRDIYFTDENNALAVGDYFTGIIRTSDGGKTWLSTPAFRGDLYQLCFLNSTTGFVNVSNNYSYFTYDGGKTFVFEDWKPPMIGHLSSTDFFMVSRDVIYTVGVHGGIAKTTDGGRSWQTYEGFSFKNNFFAITCVDENTCYACGEVAKVIKTENGGKDWKEHELMLNNSLHTIYFLNKDFGFAAGQYGVLVRTTNGGSTWQVIETSLRFTIISIRFFNDKHGIMVSKGGEIAETKDGGLTWNKVVGANYGVNSLQKAVIKDSTTVFGIENRLIVKYDL